MVLTWRVSDDEIAMWACNILSWKQRCARICKNFLIKEDSGIEDWHVVLARFRTYTPAWGWYKSRKFPLGVQPPQWLVYTQAVCVTTHKGWWVKLLLCLISIVTRSSSHLVREMNQTQGSKHCCLFWKNITEESDLGNFQDLIEALDACYWLHKTISISLSRFGDDRAI